MTVIASSQVSAFLLDPEVVTRYGAGVDPVYEQLVSIGFVRNKEKFCHERDEIYAAKRHQLRTYGWFGQFEKRKAFIAAWAVMKKRPLAEPADLDRTEEFRAAFIAGGCRVESS